MTEIELSLTLGLTIEPEQNKVQMDPLIQAEIMYLKHIFMINKMQTLEVGRANPDFWADLLPWHSAN
ncbi:hypothetical protein [Vampirovibrio sp.]|uniref:hypothetical protein n=1 Tax=Vampirovibrio sp. TaxID=2717857 RepID=UPI003593F68A